MEDSSLCQGNGTAPKGSDYYVVLGIPRYSKSYTIKKAFRAKSMQYHPDRNPGDKEAEERFKSVNEAYGTLGDSVKKWDYDAALKAGRDSYAQVQPIKEEELFPGATRYHPPPRTEEDQRRDDEVTRIKKKSLENRVLRVERDLSKNLGRSVLSYISTSISSLGMIGCTYISLDHYLQEGKGDLWLPTAAVLFGALVGLKVSTLIDFSRERSGLKRTLDKIVKEIDKISKPC